MDGKKLGRSEKYYGSDCLEVGGKGEGGMTADSQVSGVGNCRRRWQIERWRWESEFRMRISD